MESDIIKPLPLSFPLRFAVNLLDSIADSPLHCLSCQQSFDSLVSELLSKLGRAVACCLWTTTTPHFWLVVSWLVLFFSAAAAQSLLSFSGSRIFPCPLPSFWWQSDFLIPLKKLFCIIMMQIYRYAQHIRSKMREVPVFKANLINSFMQLTN